MSLIKALNVSISYGTALAVENATFSVRQGEYVCLVGNNGSGKSTLIKAILGLTPVCSGKLKISAPLSKVSYMPQSNLTDNDFPATVKEIVLTGTQKKGGKIPYYSEADYAAAERAMDILGILSVSASRIGSLSGGQRQRTMLARALCRKPELLILDEPCASLDASVASDFYGLLGKLNREHGITILMASHDLSEIKKNASRVIVINRKIEYDGSASGWRG